MTVANKQVSEFLSALDALKQAPQHGDQRRAPRAPTAFDVEAKLMISGKSVGPWELAELRDISARGCCIAMRQKLEGGMVFAVRFPQGRRRKNQAPLLCRAVHCHKKNDWYVIGAEFIGGMRARQPGVESAAEQQRIKSSILGSSSSSSAAASK